MLIAKQSTAANLIVGPILDSTGAEYASAVIGDLSIAKHDATTLTALASAATLTYLANGMYSLVTTTGNMDTLGRVRISCNKSTYQMPPVSLMVVPATVYDAIVTNATNATGGLIAATATVSAVAGYVGASGAAVNGTNANTLSGHDPGATLGTSTLTQAQVTGGAYALNHASFAFASALDFTATQKAATLARVTLVDTTTSMTNTPTFNGPSAATIADAVLDEALAGHLTLGSFGYYVGEIHATGDLLYTDWEDGGRLDLILDARAAAATALSTATWTATRAGYLDNLSGGAVMLASSYSAPPSVGAIADAVWDEVLSGHLTAGTTGAGLNAAVSAGDPWSTALPGAYGAGTAGYLVGTNLNATVGSRMATYTQPTGFLAATFPGTVASTTNITAASGVTISGTTTTLDALQTAQNSAHGAGSWATATGFSTHSASDVWAVATRTITGGTITTYTGNTPQTGDAFAYLGTNVGLLGANLTAADDATIAAIGALNNLSQANVRTAIGLATANLDTQLADLPTVAEFEARTLVAAAYFDPAVDIVTTTDTTNVTAILADTNELQSDWTNTGRLDTILDTIASNVAAILADTGTDGVALSAALCNKIADHVRRRTQANVEASSDGDTLSLGSEYGFIQQAQESAASGTTLTVKKTDGTTTLGTKTVTSDAAADPVTGIS